ncbi:MAG: PAS domain-containing protein, partial [Alphaproteobacteria bacterium]|nr:PAS domain-containing protein [Alphaproteobacteria bacterium]
MMESNARYDELARCIAVGVYVFRIRADGGMGYDYVSPRFCEMLDVEAEAVLADKDVATAAIHPDDRDGLAQAGRDAAAKREPIRWEGRGVVRGEARWFRIESSPTALPDGDLRFNGVLIDITERKGLEEALLRSNADLKQFAYVASHDLQTPLRTVVSYLQLLERRHGAALDQDGRDFIGFAVGGAKHMTRLIHDLLEYSRVDSKAKEMEPVGMELVFADAIEGLASTIDECGAKIIVPPSLPIVMGDEIQLVQLIQNLIGNALKYRKPDHSPVVRVEVGESGRFHVFTIEDNGIGIEPAYFERIFQIFQRLHTAAAYEGTGIGLAVCKRVVERHGGGIWVESKPGEGSTFGFT